MEAADQPTIEQILDEYDVKDYLEGCKYEALLIALQDRDTVMRADAAEYAVSRFTQS